MPRQRYARAATADISLHARWTPGTQRRRLRSARHGGGGRFQICAQLSRRDICLVTSDRAVPRRLALSYARVGYPGRGDGGVITHDAAAAPASRMPRVWRRILPRAQRGVF